MNHNTKSSRKIWSVLFWIGAILPFVISALFYSHLPEQVVIRWNFQNQPDGYGSRNFAAWGIPAFFLVVDVILRISFASDPKKGNIDRFPLMKNLACWFVVLLGCIVQLFILTSAVGITLPASMIFGSIIGLLLIVVGNYLPKCLPSHTIGIRLPWTLASVQNWKSTHHFAGYLWMLGGVVVILGAIFQWHGWELPVLLGIALLPACYSLLYYLLRERHPSSKNDYPGPEA